MGANVGAKIVTILQAVDNIIINGILWRSDRDEMTIAQKPFLTHKTGALPM